MQARSIQFDAASREVTLTLRMANIIDERRLEDAALAYVQHYQCSVASLRRVLRRRVRRWLMKEESDEASEFPQAIEAGAVMIEALIARYVAAGILNDATYAAARTASLHRRGGSARMITARLLAKGVEQTTIAAQLSAEQAALRPGGDLAAAVALARRRRIGPFRTTPALSDRQAKDLALLCRHGFDPATARRVLACADPLAAETLAIDAAGSEG